MILINKNFEVMLMTTTRTLYSVLSIKVMFYHHQGVSGALAVLMKDAIRPNLMQTLEVNTWLSSV